MYSTTTKSRNETKMAHLKRMGAQLESERSSWEDLWRQIEEYVRPDVCEWSDSDANRGNVKPSFDKIIDDTPIDCINVLAAGLTSHVTNPARKWVDPTLQDKELARDEEVRDWLDHVRDQTLEAFRSSNLYSVLPENYAIAAAYGTSAMIFEEDQSDAFRFYVIPVGSYWCSTNSRGVVDCVMRKFTMTSRQLIDRFGEKNIPKEIRDDVAANTSTEKSHVVKHFVYPNSEYDQKSLDPRKKMYASCYFLEKNTDNSFLSESGFDEFPILVTRWSVTGRNVYGNGVGKQILPHSKMLQSYERKTAEACAKDVNPPLQAPSSMAGQALTTVPGGINYFDEAGGRQGIRSIYERGTFQTDKIEVKMEKIRYRIRRATFYDLFLLMTQEQRSNVTAEEIRARLDEKILAIGPVLERLVDDLLDPLFARALSILMRRGTIRPPPEEIEGAPMAVEYAGALAQGQKLLGLAPLDRFMSVVERIAQRDPSVVDIVNSDATVTEYADLLSVPQRLLNSAEVRQEIRQRRAAAASAKQQAEVLAQQANAARTLSETDTSSGALADLIQSQTGA
jgi:hypothetical protein